MGNPWTLVKSLSMMENVNWIFGQKRMEITAMQSMEPQMVKIFLYAVRSVFQIQDVHFFKAWFQILENDFQVLH